MNSEETVNCIQIQGPEYVIRNTGWHSWDLYLLKVVNKGKPDQKFEFKPAGFGMKFESCLRDIIFYRTKIRSKNLGKGGDEDLKKLMKIWMEEKTKLLSVLDLDEKEWSMLSCLKKIPLDQLKQRDLIDAEIAEVKEDNDDEEIEED